MIYFINNMHGLADLIGYGITGLVIGVILPVGFMGVQKKKIRKVLEADGARNIAVYWMNSYSIKNVRAFVVEYEELSGEKHSTICKMPAWGFSMFWEDKDK